VLSFGTLFRPRMKGKSGHYNEPETCRTAFVIPDHTAILLLLFCHRYNRISFKKELLENFHVCNTTVLETRPSVTVEIFTHRLFDKTTLLSLEVRNRIHANCCEIYI